MPSRTKSIKNVTRLNHVINNISTKLSRLRTGIEDHSMTDTLVDNFVARINDELSLAESFLEENRDKIDQDNLIHFEESLRRSQSELSNLRQDLLGLESKSSVEQWATHRAAEIAKNHDQWDEHLRTRPQREEEDRKKALENPKGSIQSRRQMKKALGDETKTKDVLLFLSNPENRLNPEDKKRYDTMLGKEIDEQIKLLSDALLQLQRSVPALDSTAKKIAKEMMVFQVSKRDSGDYVRLKDNMMLLMNEVDLVKDPMVMRLWHAFVTAFKGFLNWLDVAQSKLTGKTIDQPTRTHFFTTPKLTIHDAKQAYIKARDDAFSALDSAVQEQKLSHK